MLEDKGYSVEVPEMPDTYHPKIDEWVNKLKEVVGTPDKDTILVGHSIGCQTIMRYLESVDEIGGVVFVAGFFNLTKKSFESGEEKEIAKPCLDENKDGVVTEREARSGTHVVMNPRKPIGKLWLPARLHHPIALYEQRESLEWFMEDNSRWKPLIRELIDLNGDGRHSYYEIRDAMYRMFPY